MKNSRKTIDTLRNDLKFNLIKWGAFFIACASLAGTALPAFAMAPACYEPEVQIQLRNDCDLLVPSVATARATLSNIQQALNVVSDTNSDGTLRVCLRSGTTFGADPYAGSDITLNRNNIEITSDAYNRRAVIDTTQNQGMNYWISTGYNAQPRNLTVSNITFRGGTTFAGIHAWQNSTFRLLANLCFDMHSGSAAIDGYQTSIGAMKDISIFSDQGNVAIQFYRANVALMKNIAVTRTGPDYNSSALSAIESGIGSILGMQVSGGGYGVNMYLSHADAMRSLAFSGMRIGLELSSSSLGSLEDANFAGMSAQSGSAYGIQVVGTSFTNPSDLKSIRNVSMSIDPGVVGLAVDVGQVGTMANSKISRNCDISSPSCSYSPAIQIARAGMNLITDSVIVGGNITLLGSTTPNLPATLQAVSGSKIVPGWGQSPFYVGQNSTLGPVLP